MKQEDVKWLEDIIREQSISESVNYIKMVGGSKRVIKLIQKVCV